MQSLRHSQLQHAVCEVERGRVPLHTLRAEVDYGEATAHTTYGACGIKVWVFKGEVLVQDPMAQDKRLAEQQSSPAPRNAS